MKYDVRLYCYKDGSTIYYSNSTEAKDATEASRNIVREACKSLAGLQVVEVLEVELLEE